MVCLTVASSNNTLVTGCHFYGTDSGFTIYYAGPSGLTAGAATLAAYTSYALDTGNIFCYNVVYANYSGDSVSFTLQYNSQMVGNFVRGGEIAIYMCRSTNVYDNIDTDSTGNGIFVSFPSDNISMIGNKIYNSTYSALKMANQLEQGAFTAYDYNITVRNNIIFNSKLYGIELNYANGVAFYNNSVIYSASMGIYSYQGTNLTINHNKVAYFTYAIWLEMTTNSLVEHNKIMSIYPALGQNGIKLTSTSSGNTVSCNEMYGQFVYDITADSGSGDMVGVNPNIPYYTLQQERSIFEII